jgi:cytidine deaminase
MMTDQERSLLLTTAKQAGARAYCPYSKFRVGAAVMTEQGGIFGGCNVENASYGLTMCAERNAIFQAIAGTAGPVRIRALLVYTPTSVPTAPCGACRQVINEFGPDCEVLCLCDGSDEIVLTLGDLLPSAFGPRHLNG